MAKLPLNLAFWRDSIQLLLERGMKETLFGKQAELTADEQRIVDWVETHPQELKAAASRMGSWRRIDLVHKGQGHVWLLPNRWGNPKTESLLVLSHDTVITQGPDLYIYLSTQPRIERGELGQIFDLGFTKGTKGGQVYQIPKSMGELSQFRSAVIWCKQFAILFSDAALT